MMAMVKHNMEFYSSLWLDLVHKERHPKFSMRSSTTELKEYLILGLIDIVQYIEEDGVMIELGSYMGESTEIFARKFSKVYSVDSWGVMQNKQAEQIFDDTFKDSNVVQKLKSKTIDAVDKFEDKSVDFVYIDADHSYDAVKQDVINYVKKVKDGKYIGGHDYCIENIGVIKAVDELFSEPILVFPDTSWLCKKEQFNGCNNL